MLKRQETELREQQQMERWRKETQDRLEERMLQRQKVSLVVERSLRHVERQMRQADPTHVYHNVANIVRVPSSNRLYARMREQSE